MAILIAGCLGLLAVNVLVFAMIVPIRNGAVAAYLIQMVLAVLLVPALLVLGMSLGRRFRNARSLLWGAVAGLAGSLVLSVASVALSTAGVPKPKRAWNADARQAHLEEVCSTRCRSRGTDRAICDEMCACTMEKLFAANPDEELERITAEGPYGLMSREANRLLGHFGEQCAEERRGARPTDRSRSPS